MLTFDNYNKSQSPIVLWAIPSDEFLHSCVTDISIVFIKIIDTKETYCLSFNHPDLSPTMDKKTFVDELNKLDVKKWVFDKKSSLQLLSPLIENLLDINLFNYFHYAKTI